MAKAELGTKRQCQSCGAKFYDLNKDPIICPTCSVQFIIPVAAPAAVSIPSAKPDAEDADLAIDPNLVSLDELEKDGSGKKDLDVDIDIDDDEDDTFLADDEDDDNEDVSNLIESDLDDDDE